MKTNPSSTRGFFTLLAYHERARHNWSFPDRSQRTGTINATTSRWRPRIEIAQPALNPAVKLLPLPRRRIAV